MSTPQETDSPVPHAPRAERQSINYCPYCSEETLFPLEGGGWENFRAHNPHDFERFVENEFPHGRLGRAEEIGDVAAFLLSARASWITGANIVVDGAQGRPSARKFDA